MKTLGTALLGIWLAVGSQTAGTGATRWPAGGGLAASQAPAGSAAYSTGAPVDLTSVVQQYCVGCHNERTLRGNLSLATFDVAAAHERAETAEKMIVKLRAGMMPPPGVSRPADDALLALVETLETVVDAAAGDPNPGTRRFQRLSRPEYERVIRDLLALEIDASRWLPADTYLGSFDNMSDAQGLSTTLLEAYLRAAADVSRLAVGNPNAVPSSTSYTNPIEVSQHAWDQIEGTPFGTRGGMVVTHDFPADGEYVFTIETLFGNGVGFEDVDISIDGEGVALLGLEHGGGSSVSIRTEPIFVRASQRHVSAAFVRKIEGPYDDRLSPHKWSFVGGEDSLAWANYGITALPHLTDLMVTGPRRVVGLSETASRERIFTCRPDASGEARSCAETIVSRLAREAYRRPVTAADLAGPMSFYDMGAAEGGFEVGVRTALQAILASPQFIFRLEERPDGVEPGGSYRLSDVDLASRLAVFLWAANPDAELLQVAEDGRLSDPEVLAQQGRPDAGGSAVRGAGDPLRLPVAASAGRRGQFAGALSVS